MDSLTKIFWTEGLAYAKRSNSLSLLTGHRIFKSFYGVTPEVCPKLWVLLKEKPINAEPKHLLWTLIIDWKSTQKFFTRLST